MIKEHLNITLIQSELYWEDIDANLSMFEEQIWQLNGPSDMIILPEMFSTGFTMKPQHVAEPMNSKTFRWMKLMASQQQALVVGSYVVKENNQFYNRLFCVEPDGTFSYYDKKHLFTLAGEDQCYTPGVRKVVVEWKGWRILPLVCYDLRFPVWSRSRIIEDRTYEYDLLVYVANWPVPRIAAWDTLLKARAIENIAFSVGVNRAGKDENGLHYPGHSAVYDYTGSKLLSMKDKVGIKTVTIKKDLLEEFRTHFPFQEDADNFQLQF
jgi:predicted amidohydrolase